MTKNKMPNAPYGAKLTPKETLQDKTTAVAMKIIANDQKRQLEQIAKLKAARIEKEGAEALIPVSRKRKSRKG